MISSRKHGVTEAQNLHQKHLPPSFLSDCVEPARKVPVSVCVLSAALLGSAGWAATMRQTFQPRDRMQARSCVFGSSFLPPNSLGLI